MNISRAIIVNFKRAARDAIKTAMAQGGTNEIITCICDFSYSHN